VTPDAKAAIDAGGPADAAAPPFCQTAGLSVKAFSEGPYGPLRHETADDFTLPLVDGTSWNFRKEWTGCESYVFIPDTLTNSALDETSIWARDVDFLVATSPTNAHYFFASRKGGTADSASTSAMKKQIDDALASLDAQAAAHWRAHLHVVKDNAGRLSNWVGDVLLGHGQLGFAIDRFQKVRGIGSFADVNRYSQALKDKEQWPWEANLAYAANEARYFNYEVTRQVSLDATKATVVSMYQGETLAEFAEKEVQLPSAEEMATFDTFEIDVTQRCPNVNAPEPGNCGAWDYLAYLFVYDKTDNRVELGRFITSYHREGRFVVDVTPMLVHLREGGLRKLRWEFAPPWNKQPTATWLDMRFSNKGKGYKPAEATFLWGSKGFNLEYNKDRTPIDVTVPSDAKRVEVWAIITGHGMDGANNCAEFCNHQHEFTVNGKLFLHEHREVRNNEGCMAQIENGTVPNQHGTWWFGRGGWCPGKQVDPFVADVTELVLPTKMANVAYRGLLKGVTPTDGGGNISMASYLVVYR
jgi:hypothetical protein